MIKKLIIKNCILIVVILMIVSMVGLPRPYTVDQVRIMVMEELEMYHDESGGVYVYMAWETDDYNYRIDQRFVNSGYQPWDEYQAVMINQFLFDVDSNNLYHLDKITLEIDDFVCQIDPSKHAYIDFEKNMETQE